MSDLLLCISVRLPPVDVVEPDEPSVLQDSGVTAAAEGIFKGVNLFK